jgi:stearoyl-CoA desaturase (delta-9 desaturase)
MTTWAQLARPGPAAAAGPQPILDGQRTWAEQLLVKIFVVVPLLALIAAVPLA